jgi:hypothetical protein
VRSTKGRQNVGSPIPNRDLETNTKVIGEVSYYTISKEEIDAIVAQPIPAGHHKPMGFGTRNKEVRDMAKITRDQYLETRA